MYHLIGGSVRTEKKEKKKKRSYGKTSKEATIIYTSTHVAVLILCLCSGMVQLMQTLISYRAHLYHLGPNK